MNEVIKEYSTMERRGVVPLVRCTKVGEEMAPLVLLWNEVDKAITTSYI